MEVVKLIAGASATTESETEAVTEPAELVAVMVYEVAARTASGVPLITQVEESIDAQAGSAGEAVQEVIEAP